MTPLDEVLPRRKRLVFDLAEEAGFDTADWRASSRSATAYRANPKYCYNWSLLTPGRVLILNLWFDMMRVDATGTITCAENYRQDAAELRAQGGKTKWIERGMNFDRHLQEAIHDALPIRVIVNHGRRRNRGDAAAAASKVDFRDLDAVPWHVRHYDQATGAFVLARGTGQPPIIDQFDLEESAPDRRQRRGSAFVRDPKVRRAALARSKGRCEYCGIAGFETASGARYLETHHIAPLGERGRDTLANVIALCPNDHRRAHFAQERIVLAHEMLAKIEG